LRKTSRKKSQEAKENQRVFDIINKIYRMETGLGGGLIPRDQEKKESSAKARCCAQERSMVVSTVKDNRSATSSIPKPRLEPNSGARRVAATAIARQLAIRENSVYSWLENQNGFESPSIFEWRGFPGEGATELQN
jgi:hypothetical protein